MNVSLSDFKIAHQPNDTACGPTCLHAVYRYYGDKVSLKEVFNQTAMVPTGGTLAVFLGNHALSRGYQCKIYTYNLKVFDPTWFSLGRDELMEKLKARKKSIGSSRQKVAIRGYLEFLRGGGIIAMEDMRPTIIRRALKKGMPILTGLSSTYLYQKAREYGPEDDDDDIRGEPQGHFVVVCGYSAETKQVQIADPLHDNPAFERPDYQVPLERLITAILLGIVTYDANLLIIAPKGTSKKELP